MTQSEAERAAGDAIISIVTDGHGIEDDPVEALLREMLNTDDLDNIPSLEPLIADVLFLDTLARINGASGTMKSFLAIDFAGCVGTGKPWHGRDVRQGQVVYIVAEGAKGVRKRVRAWEQHYGRKMTGVRFLPRPVQVRSTEWDILIEACHRIEPAFILIDTQARVTVGVEENSATEMGIVMDRMERLRSGTGACVLAVHHAGLNGEHGRGSTAVKGALQTEMSVKRKGKGIRDTRITLSTGKQKDDEELGDQVFGLCLIEIKGEAKEDGSPVTSVVLIPEDEQDRDGEPDPLMEQKIRVAKTLAAATEAVSQKYIEQHTPGNGVKTRTALTGLIDSGHVEFEFGPRNARLHRLIKSYPDLTSSLSPPRPHLVQDEVTTTSSSSPPFRGDEVDEVSQATETPSTSSTTICPSCGFEPDSKGHEVNCENS